MIKKIIHIADIHLRTNQLHELYGKQFQSLVTELTEKYGNYKHDEIRIVIAGDLVHQKINISNEQLLLLSQFLIGLSKIGKVVILPGNHDFLENNMERVDSITPIIELLRNEHIEYYKDYGVYVDDNVNWVIYSLYQHNKRPEFTREEGKLYIGLFHGPIQGFSTDLGFQFDDAYDKINFNGCDIVMCGDIHKRAIVNLENEVEVIESEVESYIRNGWEKSNTKGSFIKKIPIIQIGSLIQQNFGETVKHHGYGTYDIETNKYEFTDLDNEQPYLHFSINDITDIENDKEVLLNLG